MLTAGPCGGAVLGRAALAGQVAGGVDEAHVTRTPAGSCRAAAATGSYSSESRPDVVAERQQPLEQLGGLAAAALQGEVVGQPERAGEEGALARRQAVDVGLRLVALPRSRRSSGAARWPRPCRSTRGSVGGQEADERHHQQAGVEVLRRRRTGRRRPAPGRSPAGRPRRGSRRGPPASARPARSRPNCSTALTARSTATQAMTFGVGEVRGAGRAPPRSPRRAPARPTRGTRPAPARRARRRRPARGRCVGRCGTRPSTSP